MIRITCVCVLGTAADLEVMRVGQGDGLDIDDAGVINMCQGWPLIMKGP